MTRLSSGAQGSTRTRGETRYPRTRATRARAQRRTSLLRRLQRLQLRVLLGHLHNDVMAAHQLARRVQLRVRRPVRVFLEPLADLRRDTPTSTQDSVTALQTDNAVWLLPHPFVRPRHSTRRTASSFRMSKALKRTPAWLSRPTWARRVHAGECEARDQKQGHA